MPTLGELLKKFDAEAGQKTAAAQPSDLDVQLNAALEGGSTKTASQGGDQPMTLQDIYLQMMDMDKTAGAAPPAAPGATAAPTDEELAAAAEKLASDEAAAQLAAQAAEPSEEEIVKIAAEYDAAGRIMFRGFYDEFSKLASGVH